MSAVGGLRASYGSPCSFSMHRSGGGDQVAMRTRITACSWRRLPTRNLWLRSRLRPREVPAGRIAVGMHGIPDRSWTDNALPKVRASSLLRMCRALFTDYPLAINPVGRGTTSSSMILALPGDGDVAFFVLSRNRRLSGASYALRPWRAPGISRIQPANVTASEVVMNVVSCGVPLPRDGSVFGWRNERAITALVTFNVRYAPEHSEPSWAVMPLTDVPQMQWPPFIGRRILGRWFWEYHKTGTMVWLDRLITQNPRTLYWVDTKALLGWDCCVVAHDIAARDGFTLHRGRYVYYEALRAGKAIPAIDTLLAEPNKIDLAPRFRTMHVRPRLVIR